MSDLNLILPHGDDLVQVMLACGHWSQLMSNRSSLFDFPMDEVHCPICTDMRYLDVRLQVQLLKDRGES